MKNKIISILICTLFITSINAIAGNMNDPEITDVSGDAFGYLDIDSVWFTEEGDNPDTLFVSMQINEPSYWKFQQTFAVFWEYDGVEYFCALHLGFNLGDEWTQYSAGKNRADDFHINLSGTYKISSGVITWEVPKEFIGEPGEDDVLTNTWSNAFRRLGFIGRIGLSRVILDNFIFRFFGNSMWDYAPDSDYGMDYTIQY